LGVRAGAGDRESDVLGQSLHPSDRNRRRPGVKVLGKDGE
jgi:hypothetical protein